MWPIIWPHFRGQHRLKSQPGPPPNAGRVPPGGSEFPLMTLVPWYVPTTPPPLLLSRCFLSSCSCLSQSSQAQPNRTACSLFSHQIPYWHHTNLAWKECSCSIQNDLSWSTMSLPWPARPLSVLQLHRALSHTLLLGR